MQDRYFKYLVLWGLRILILHLEIKNTLLLDIKQDTINAWINETTEYMHDLIRQL